MNVASDCVAVPITKAHDQIIYICVTDYLPHPDSLGFLCSVMITKQICRVGVWVMHSKEP